MKKIKFVSESLEDFKDPGHDLRDAKMESFNEPADGMRWGGGWDDIETDIWIYLLNGKTRGEVIKSGLEEYEISREDLTNKVNKVFNDLAKEGKVKRRIGDPKSVNESINNGIIAFHTSTEPITTLSSNPMWFSPTEDLARVYHQNVREDFNGEGYTYKALIKGKILSFDEADQAFDELGIDFIDLTSELASNPTPSEVEELIAEVRNVCDGFYMLDYDPRDHSKDVKSILVFNPQKNVKISERIL